MKKRRLGPASPPTSMQGTPPFQHEVVAPRLLTDAVRTPTTNGVIQERAVDAAIYSTMTKERTAGIPEDVEPDILALQRAGIVSTDPAAAHAKPAGSLPALRIACPVCNAPPGVYCTRIKPLRYVVTGPQRIAHKKRRELEERTSFRETR